VTTVEDVQRSLAAICYRYNDDFQENPSTNVGADAGECAGLPCHAALSIGPYSVLIFSQ